MERIALIIIKWMIDRWLPTYHLKRKPTKKVYRCVELNDVKDIAIEQLKARREEEHGRV